MIIDSHVHYTPPSLRTWLERHSDREPYWDLLLNSPHSVQGWVTADRMIEQMDMAGIDQVVLVGEYWQQHDSCVRRNDQVLDIIARYPKRVMGMAVVQPTAGTAALQEAERCLDAGMIGIGELNPYAQNFSLTDGRFEHLVDLCEKRHVPINLHVGEEIGRYYVGKSNTPLRHYYELVCRYPAVKWIFAHWGGGILFYEMMPTVRRQLTNVWYDTAASPLLYPTKRIINTALLCIDHRKILYGSDYPLRLYPRKMVDPDFTTFLNALCHQITEAEQKVDIVGRNFLAMLDHIPDKKNAEPIPPDTMMNLLTSDPRNKDILAAYRLPTDHYAIPAWEPIRQTAAAHGIGREEQNNLFDRLFFEDER